MPSGIGPVVDFLKVLLKQVSEENGVASKLLATSDDLEAIAMNDDADVPALQGWRWNIFGNLAIAFKKGELLLGFKGKRLVLTRVGSSA